MNLSPRTALLLIDVQQGLDDPRYGTRNNPEAEQRIADLLAVWRADGRPVEGEPVFQKHVNSAFIGTGLEAYLRTHGIEALVVAGITTDHCVSATVRMAANLGFAVTVVEDACATFERQGPDGTHYSADLMHRVTIASLHGEFATVRKTGEVLGKAEHTARKPAGGPSR